MTRRFPAEPVAHPDPVLPPDPDLETIHTRVYEVRAFKVSRTEFMLRGAVRDHKPAGLYVPEDPELLTIHHMMLEMRITFPGYEILEVVTNFDEFPNEVCPSIIPKYQMLVGRSIMRGFNKFARENFGGPNGCTHTTALLAAMAPVAIQVGWSMRVSNSGGFGREMRPLTPDEIALERQSAIAGNINTCHVWHEDGEHVAGLKAGRPSGLPISVRKRRAKLGLPEA